MKRSSLLHATFIALRGGVLPSVLMLATAGWLAMSPAAHAQSHAVGNAEQMLPPVAPPAVPPSTAAIDTTHRPGMSSLLEKTITPATIRIEGVKSIPFAAASQRFAGFVGKPTTVKALIDAASDITHRYQDAGYALSFAYIPTQDFANGVVRVVAVEGYVASISITGAVGNAEGKIRAFAAHLLNERPLRRATFERYTALLGQMPGLKIAANIAPPTSTDGATELKLSATRTRIAASTGVNFNQPGVQGLFNVSENGMLSLGEQLSLSALAPPGRDHQTYFAGSYSQPIGSNGLSIKADVSRYRGAPDATLGLPDYVQRTVKQDKEGLSLAYPLILSQTRSLNLSGTAYGVANEDRYTNRDNGASLGLRSQARVLQTDLAWADSTGAGRAAVVTRAAVTIAKGIDALGASKNGYTNVAGAAPDNPVDLNFLRIGASASQTRSLPLGFAAMLSATGQQSRQSLPTSEQITFGGQRFGLGYEPGEAAGDSGWGAALELSRPFSINTAFLKALTPYLSYAIARTYLSHSSVPPARLATIAAGMRVSDSHYYSLDLSVGLPVGDTPVESSSRKPRVNATFSYQLD
ncbi:MAG: ShlB/FhaC/HecB family hemolysin secretion/activation protein [Janthinobacterium lividum]